MLAASAVYGTQSHWPDLIVAFLMNYLFLHSATQIIHQATSELNTNQIANSKQEICVLSDSDNI